MESSIAEFLMRQLASEQLPISTGALSRRTHALPAFSMQGTSSAEDYMARSLKTAGVNLSHYQWPSADPQLTYFLGLLAMIKCSIDSAPCLNASGVYKYILIYCSHDSLVGTTTVLAQDHCFSDYLSE